RRSRHHLRPVAGDQAPSRSRSGQSQGGEVGVITTENTPTTRWIGRHLLATICAAAFFTIVPSALYGGLVVWFCNLVGPLNLILIPAVSAVAGFTISVVLFVPVSLLAERTNLQNWRRMVAVLLVALTVPVALTWASVGTIKPQNRVNLVVSSVSVYVVA